MHFIFVLIFFLLLCFSTIVDGLCIRRLWRAKQKAEKSVAIKSSTLAILSHEIRSPLTGVLSIVQLLGETTLDDVQRKLLNTLGNASNELLSLLNGTLEQSRMEANQLSITHKNFILEELINNLLTLFEVQAIKKGLLLTAHIDQALPAILVGDEGKIRQILLNLLSNAIKFTAHGIVKLQVEKSCQSGNNVTVCFRITDSGIGMPPEAAQQLFAPFNQGLDIQRRFGGTGLGLSISRELARAMAGDIVVESEENRGSMFTLHLPLAYEIPDLHIAPTPITTAPLVPNIPPLKILVIDDTDIHRIAACCLLESEGHRVTLATSAIEAISLLTWQIFECIFIDVCMPDIDGTAAIRKIRSMPHHGKQPPCIIVLSAWLQQDDIEELLACGADAACSKPMDLQTINQILATIPHNLQNEAQNISASLPPRRDSRIS